MKNILTVQKEHLNGIKFSQAAGEHEKINLPLLRFDLNRALILGNTDHYKVTIVFVTEGRNLQQVYTTIWAVTEDTVCLKGGLYIPIMSILDLEI